MIPDEELYEAFETLMLKPDDIDDYCENKYKMENPEASASEIEIGGEKRLEEYVRSFKPEFLHQLLSNDSDFIENGELSNKYKLKGKQVGELTILLVEHISAKFEEFVLLSESLRNNMVKMLLKLTGVKGRVQSKDLDLAEIDRSKSIAGDTKQLDEMLKNFLDETGKMLTYKNTIVADRDLTRVSLKNQNVKKKDIERWKYLIDNQKPSVQTQLHPLLIRLRTYDKVDVQIIHLDADHIIGNLDLKRLDRRKRIYNFWRGHKGKYDNFVSAYNACNEAFAPIWSNLIEGKDTETKDMQEIREVIDTFLAFKEPINNGELDYVVKIKPKELEPYFRRHKGLALFEKFLEDTGLDNERSDDESRGAKLEGYYDKETGERKETVTVEQGGTTFDEESQLAGAVDAAEQKEEMKELSRFGLKLKRINQKVDPLFYHAFTKDGGAFKNTAVFANEVKTLREAMLSAGAARELATGIDMDDEINAYVDEIEKTVARSGNGPYYLPLTESVNRFMITEDWNVESKSLNTEVGIRNRLKAIGDFLNVISTILDAGDDLDRASSPSKAEHISQTGGPKQTLPQLGTKNRKDHMDTIEEAEREFRELIEAVLDYYVVPMSGSNKPFDDELPFDSQTQKTRRIFRALATGKTDTALFKVLALEGRAGSLMVKATEMEELARMLEFLTAVDDKKDISRLVNELKNGAKIVDFILLNKKNDEETSIEFGSYLHQVLDANDLDWPEGELFRGKTPSEWNEMYDTSKVYPFEAIESHIRRNRMNYSDSKRTMVRGSDRNKKGSSTVVQRFFTAIDNMKILRSDTDSKLLQAHDNIRKMLGKPVYYNTGKTDNYEHVNSAVQIMKSKFRVDVSAYEIEKIVSELNSMEEISRKHGVPSEGVYFLKASFR